MLIKIIKKLKNQIKRFLIIFKKDKNLFLKIRHFKIKDLSKIDPKIILVLSGFILLCLSIWSLNHFIHRNRFTNKLSSAPITSNYLYQSINKDYKVYLGDKMPLKQTPKAAMTSGNSSIDFTLDKVSFGSLMEKKNDKTIFYRNVYPDVDFSYSLTEKGFKEEVKINSIKSLKYLTDGLTFKLNLKNAVPQKDLMGNLIPTFVDDKTGNYRFHFETPFMIDAKGNRSYEVGLKIKLNEKKEYELILKPEINWLKNVVYPVIIDPSLTHDEQSDFTNGSFNRVNDVGIGATTPSIQLIQKNIDNNISINTIGFWSMENNWNDSSPNALNGTGSGSPTFTTDSKFGSYAGNFVAASSQYVSLGTSALLNPDNQITVEAWVKTTSVVDYAGIVARDDATNRSWKLGFQNGAGNGKVRFDIFNASTYAAAFSTSLINDGNWHHVAGTFNGTHIGIYVDGVLEDFIPLAGPIRKVTTATIIGRDPSVTSPQRFFNGQLDEIAIYNIAKTQEEVKQDAQKRPYGTYTSSSVDLGTTVASLDSLKWSENIPSGTAASGLPKSYIEFQTRTSVDNLSWEEWKPVGIGETVLDNMDDFSFWALPNSSIWSGIPVSTASETTIKVEGTNSIKTVLGTPIINANTKGLWHFDETGVGTGSTAYDLSGNNNNLITNTASLIEGFYGKGRSFNGSSDYLYQNASPLNMAWGWSLEAWIKPSNLNQLSLAIYVGNDAGGFGFGLGNGSGSTGAMLQGLFGGVAWLNSGYTFSNVNQWYHVVMTRDGTPTTKFYVNGVQTPNTSSAVVNVPFANKFSIGMQYNSSNNPSRYFAGSIDEVRVLLTVLTAEEIAEAYRAGRDHRIERTLSSTDLSSNNKIPFYIASDRLGTYLETYTGETSHSVYQADANTVGLWHLDEKSGSGAYLKDSSGNNNHVTPTGALFTQGKIGGARYFNGSNYYLSRSSVTTYNNSRTVEFWFLPTTTGAQRGIISVGNSVNDGTPMWLITQRATNVFSVYHGGGYRDGTTTITPNIWHYGVYTFNSTGNAVALYLDGKLEYSGTVADSNTNNTNLYIGTGYNAYFTGLIDEVRISNTVRSVDEIRQAYEYGLRTHQITIDYSTGIGSSAPTSTSDLDFNPTATENLYVGDVVIVREKVGATTYIMQGEVTGISSGAVTVASWSGTAPPSGYTTSADVFKWQKEYWDISDISTGDRDAITKLGIKVLDGSEGFDMYLDDFKASGAYLTDPNGGETITSTPQRYFQYKAIFTTNDTTVTPALSSVTLDYTTNRAPIAPTNLLTNSQTNPTALGVGTTSPYFSAVYNDPDATDIANKYQIQLDDDLDFNEILILDNADTVSNWTSSDDTYFTKAQDTGDKQEGTGSIQMTASSVTDDVFYYLKTLGNGTTASAATKYANIDMEVEVKEGNQTISTDTSWGSATPDTRMLGVRVEGDLTIDAGTTLTAATRKKGMAIYVDGDLNLNGTISMTARGANATGQQVLLLNDGTEYQVPAVGGEGGASVSLGAVNSDGNTGTSGVITGACGGGGGGGLANIGGSTKTKSGGSVGTSYSGGTGGGGGALANGQDGIANGGAGGAGAATNTAQSAGGGAGNPGGAPATSPNGVAGGSGTGGLLVLYVTGTLTFGESGTLSSMGVAGGAASGKDRNAGGGGTGGGHIDYFYNTISGTPIINLTAGAGGIGTQASGGAGGDGSSRATQSDLLAPNALNSTLIKDLGSDNIENLSGFEKVKFWVKSTRSGSYLQFGIGESAWDDNTFNITINSADAWEEKEIDISEISNSNKDAIRYLGFKTTNADTDFTFNFDDIKAEPDSADPLIWDSGSSGTVMGDCAQGNRCTDILYDGSDLSGNTTYYWRIKFWDDDGGEGAWSTETATFSVNYTPLAPTGLLTEGLTNPDNIIDTTPEFSAIYNENVLDIGDTANKYQIQVDDDPLFGSPIWDSGSSGTVMDACIDGNRCSDISYGGNASDLQWNSKYYWRIKFWDDDGDEGSWDTESAYFTMMPIYEPTSCLVDDGGQPTATVLSWNDNTDLETSYRIERSVDDGEWTLLSSEAANTISYNDQTTAGFHTYLYRVRAESDNGNSQWCGSSQADYSKGNLQMKGVIIK